MTLIDLAPLRSVPKMVRPISKQHQTESRKLWESVTSRLLRKEFGEATRAKHVIEQRQRDEAAERKRRGVECVNFSSSLSLPTSVPEGEGGLNSRVHVLITWSFYLFIGLCPSTLTRIYRVACRHLRRQVELRSRQSSSTRTRLPLIRENAMIIMVVRRPHKNRKHI